MTSALLEKNKNVGRREFLKISAAISGGLCIAAYIPELRAGARELAPSIAHLLASVARLI